MAKVEAFTLMKRALDLLQPIASSLPNNLLSEYSAFVARLGE
jgi:hypothetical protein